MKPLFVVFPFLSILIGALGTILASKYPDQKILFYSLGWGGALSLILFWIWLDIKGFQRLFAQKGTRYGASSGLVVLLGLSVIVGIASLTSRPRFDKSIDLTKDKRNTLSEQSISTIETVKKRSAEVDILAYFQAEDQKNSFKEQLDLYLGNGLKAKVEYVNPQREPIRAQADKLTNANTVIFKLGNQENRITTFTEEKITNALVSVLKETTKKIAFTKGHGEGQIDGSDPNGFNINVQELKNNKFDVVELNLVELTVIPEDVSTLMISGPKYDFKDGEISLLRNFIERGGAVGLFVDAMVEMPTLFGFLRSYGLSINNDFLILSPNDPRAQLFGQNIAFVSEFDEFNPVTKDFSKSSSVNIVTQNTRSVSDVTENEKSFKVSIVGKVKPEGGIKVKDVKNQNDLKNIDAGRIERGTFGVIATSMGKAGEKEVRLVVVGSSQFANNQGAQTSSENRDLFQNIVNYLAQDDDFITIRPKDPTKSTLDVSTKAAGFNLAFISFLYPFLFLFGGVAYWFQRRRA
jgi:ABC-type uncharacterized transport system involved in gliding motility auxiliary subunit